MAHPVKCFYCGKTFDRDKIPAEKVTATRWAHKSCYDSHGTNPEKKVDFEETKTRGGNTEMSRNNRELDILFNTLQKTILSTVADFNKDELFSTVFESIEEEMKTRYGFIPKAVYKVETPTATRKIEGVLHEKFNDVLQIVNLNIPVYLTGKAGTGKNVICKQVAESLGLDFYFTNAVTQEYKLTGFIDANGNYQETQFYKAFTQGGVFFLDEMDASVPEVLIILNAAIANGYFDFPIGKVEAHPDFRVIAAGNTIGTGADSNYTGRFSLDRASLDRFALIEIDYSPTIEMAMANNKADIVNFARAFRAACDECGIDCLFSYRTINRISLLEDVFENLHEVIEISLLKGMCIDDVQIIKSCIERKLSNKYVSALVVD